MRSFFNELLEYNRHMNNEVIRALVQHKNTISERSVKLMSHILNVQEIFNVRIMPMVESQAHGMFAGWRPWQRSMQIIF